MGEQDVAVLGNILFRAGNLEHLDFLLDDGDEDDVDIDEFEYLASDDEIGPEWDENMRELFASSLEDFQWLVPDILNLGLRNREAFDRRVPSIADVNNAATDAELRRFGLEFEDVHFNMLFSYTVQGLFNEIEHLLEQ